MTRDELVSKIRLFGMSQKEFADRIGLSVATVHHWQNPPQYAAVILEAWEKIKQLGGKI